MYFLTGNRLLTFCLCYRQRNMGYVLPPSGLDRAPFFLYYYRPHHFNQILVINQIRPNPSFLCLRVNV